MSTSKHKQMNIFIYVHICKQEIHLLLRNEKKQGKEKKALNIKLFLGGVGFGGVVQEWNSEFGSNKVRR